MVHRTAMPTLPKATFAPAPRRDLQRGASFTGVIGKRPVSTAAGRRNALNGNALPATSPQANPNGLKAPLMAELGQALAKRQQGAEPRKFEAAQPGVTDKTAIPAAKHSKNVNRLKSALQAGNPKHAMKARHEAAAEKVLESTRLANEKLGQKHRSELEAALPKGVTVDESGKVSGTISMTETFAAGGSKQNIQEAYEARVLANLAKLEAGTIGKTTGKAEQYLVDFKVDADRSFVINNPAIKDIARFADVTIMKDGQKLMSKDILVEATKHLPSGDQQTAPRVQMVIAALASLCDQNADGTLTEAGKRQLVALTTVYNQEVVGLATTGIEAKEGGMLHLSVAKMDCRSAEDGRYFVSYYDESGKSQERQLRSNMGHTQLTISRTGDTITFANRLTNDFVTAEQSNLPHMNGHALLCDMKTKIDFDLEALRAGKPGMTYHPVEVEISGNMPKF